jgi:hypothetical protein
VIYIRGSFAKIARFKELTGKMISIDNRTKWNNSYEIFLIFLNLKSAIEKYYSDYKDEFKKDILNFADWKKLRTIKNFLIFFIQIIFIAEGDSIFINFILFIMDVLIKYLQNQIISNLSFLFFFKIKTNYRTIGHI